MHRRWLSLPLLSSCVSAFYPCDHGDDGDAQKPNRFVPVRANHPTKDNGAVRMDLHKVERRDSQFPVVLSNKPDAPNGLAINQDGNDYSYFASMQFGSKDRDMYMLIDTGSANTWVFGSDCTSKACSVHNTFGPEDSNTLNVTKDEWSLAYGTGSVSGLVASDTVSFAKYSVELGFGLAHVASDDFSNYPMDGILGLGRASSDQLGTPTLVQVLSSTKSIQQKVVGVHLHRAADGTKDGEITFGGVDTTKFSGELAFTPTSGTDMWEIPATDALVNGKPCNFKKKSAVIDTGTSYVLMPPSDATALHNLIPGSVQKGGAFTVPCDTQAKLEFSFSGKSYAISPKDYVGKPSNGVCTSNIIAHQAFGPDEWILGDVFLKNVYAVFDYDQNRIGLGTPGSGGSAGAATTTSSSSTRSSSASSTSIPSSASAAAAVASSSSSSNTATVTPSASGAASSSTSSSSASVDTNPSTSQNAAQSLPTANRNLQFWLFVVLAFYLGLIT